MSFITSINKEKGVVAGFDPTANQMKKVENTTEVKDVTLQKIDRISMAKEALLHLDEGERNKLLVELFNDDLGIIVEQEKERLARENKLILEEKVNKGIELAVNQRNTEIDEHLNNFRQAVKVFSEAPPMIKFDNEQQIIELVVASVFKLIEINVTDDSSVSLLLKKLANELFVEEKLVLKLGTTQYQMFKKLNAEDNSSEKIKVVEAKEMLPFSYKITMDNGDIETNLEQKLKDFIQLMITTFYRNQNEVRRA